MSFLHPLGWTPFLPSTLSFDSFLGLAGASTPSSTSSNVLVRPLGGAIASYVITGKQQGSRYIYLESYWLKEALGTVWNFKVTERGTWTSQIRVWKLNFYFSDMNFWQTLFLLVLKWHSSGWHKSVNNLLAHSFPTQHVLHSPDKSIIHNSMYIQHENKHDTNEWSKKGQSVYWLSS